MILSVLGYKIIYLLDLSLVVKPYLQTALADGNCQRFSTLYFVISSENFSLQMLLLEIHYPLLGQYCIFGIITCTGGIGEGIIGRIPVMVIIGLPAASSVFSNPVTILLRHFDGWKTTVIGSATDFIAHDILLWFIYCFFMLIAGNPFKRQWSPALKLFPQLFINGQHRRYHK